MSNQANGARRHAVIVDDDPATTKLLRYLLEDEGYRVTVLCRGQAAVETVTSQETSLVLLDVNLPDIDGFTLTKLLRAHRYFGPLIVLTGRGGIADKLSGFQNGADDYLTKPFEPLELLARIESVTRRSSVADDEALGRVLRVADAVLSIGDLTYRSDTVAAGVRLTPMEMRLLEILMRNNQIIISRERLIERVWGYSFVGETNRVDVYIRRLRSKIEADPRAPRYLHTVRGTGYVFRIGAPAAAEAGYAEACL